MKELQIVFWIFAQIIISKQAHFLTSSYANQNQADSFANLTSRLSNLLSVTLYILLVLLRNHQFYFAWETVDWVVDIYRK